MPSTQPTFGEVLRRQRRRLDLTQNELAKRAGCARVTIHKLEADDMRPSKQLAELLAQALQIPATEREAFVQLARGSATLVEAEPETLAAEASLYRRIFIGREAELKQTQAAFDAALAGQGSLLMVMGEPGIGKTALCERLAAYAIQHGGRALTGHNYEEGSLSIPYLPFIEALRAYVLAREPNALRRELSAGAADVARIVPEVRERLGLALRQAQDAQEVERGPATADDRYRLLEAVTNFLRGAAATQPLVLVLEDLHWADRGTLDLLLYVARHLAGARLLLVGTYRDVEVDRAHPLAAALADLRRAGAFGRILLRGFGVDDVQRMLSRIAEQEVPQALAEAVHRQTEGNPLFIEEVIRYLGEAGLIARDAQTGRWRADGATPLAMQIPEGLRDVIGKRLSRLSATCNRVLAVAAVIGRDFALSVLQRVAGLSEDEVFAALEEAQRAAIVEERRATGASLTYRFTHALFRQTLYEETFTPRRIRLHQQVARALEAQYAGRLSEHAAEMAEHFAQSSDTLDLTKAVEYGALAAQRAMSVYAYSEAVRLLEQALQAQDVLDPDDKAKRCDLLLALGEALIPAGEPKRVTDEVAAEAFTLADALKDDERCSKASLLAIRGVQAFGAALSAATPAFQHWAERADRYAKAGTSDRVYADGTLAEVYFQQGRLAENWALTIRTLEQARQLAAPEPYFFAAMQVLQYPRAPQHRTLKLELVEELTSRSHAGVSLMDWGYLLRVCGGVYLDFGERQKAEVLWRELAELATRTEDAYVMLLPFTTQAWLATLDGRLEEAVEFGAQLVARADELGSPVVGRQYASQCTARALICMGRAEEALENWESARQAADLDTDGVLSLVYRAFVLIQLAQRAEAQSLVWQAIEEGRIGRDEDETTVALLANLLEVANQIGDRALVALLAGRLSNEGAFFENWQCACIGGHLAAAATLLGDKEKAAEYNREALGMATKVRSRPEIALIRLQMAELGLDNVDELKRVEAQAHLDFAIGEFRAMKMQPSLERALRLKAEG